MPRDARNAATPSSRWLTIDIREIVSRCKGRERIAPVPSPQLEQLVEGFLPRRFVGARSIGDDAVHVEDHRIESVSGQRNHQEANGVSKTGTGDRASTSRATPP